MKKRVSVLLNNIRSVHNVGSIFRTSDALGVDKIFLSGTTPTPVDRFGDERKDFVKVSLGAEKSIQWEYVEDVPILIEKMKKEGAEIISLEQAPNSVDYKKVKVTKPILFICGNEVSGVEEYILEKSDVIIEIPMMGRKESFNVSVSFGIALSRILDH